LWLCGHLNFKLFGPEAGAAVNGTVTLWLEGHPCRRAAFGTIYFSGATGILAIALDPHENPTIRATLWFIDQPFSAEKLLFASREDESLTAITTGEVFVLE
jgi:hypothetical protein